MQTGMLSLILVELHKMFRWFVSSIILHHAQYIEWFSNLFEWSCQHRPLRRVRRKTKREIGCFTCGSEEHWANKCPNKYKKPGQDSKSINVTLSNNDGASGYGNLFNVLSVCQSTNWWVDTGPIF